MQIIKHRLDIKNINNSIPNIFHDFVENYFHQLESAQTNDDQKEFCLNLPGYIVLLEAGDNLSELGRLGLNHEDRGLLGSNPEYVDLIDLSELLAYRIGIMLDNEYMITFFTLKRIHDEETEQWLKEQAERY